MMPIGSSFVLVGIGLALKDTAQRYCISRQPDGPAHDCSDAASVARRVYLRGGIGIGSLQIAYGGRDTNDTRRPRFARAARGTIRHAMHQLEKAKIIGQRDGKK